MESTPFKYCLFALWYTVLTPKSAHGVGEIIYSDGGQHNTLTFGDAKEECTKYNALIATKSDLRTAWQNGYERCSSGWLRNGEVWMPKGDQCGTREFKMVEDKKVDKLLTYNVYCYKESPVTDIIGEVFPVRGGGSYLLTYSEARAECRKYDAAIARNDQLYQAWLRGLGRCQAGWLDDGSVRYPMQSKLSVCGNTVGIVTFGFQSHDKTFDTYCYRDVIRNQNGTVFHVESSDGVYQMTFLEAMKECQKYNAEIATYAELYDAWTEGLSICRKGWISSGRVKYPMRDVVERCGNKTGIIPAGFPDGDAAKCDVYCYGVKPEPEWEIYNGCMYYADQTEAYTYSQAREICGNKDSSLVSINSDRENNFLKKFSVDKAHLWIGLNDIATEGQFEWEDGSPYTYSAWFGLNPDNYGNMEDCVHVNKWEDSLWNDLFCGERLGFICEKDIDECNDVTLNVCHENATCINNIGSFVCECKDGFDGNGQNCSLMTIEKTTQELNTLLTQVESIQLMSNATIDGMDQQITKQLEILNNVTETLDGLDVSFERSEQIAKAIVLLLDNLVDIPSTSVESSYPDAITANTMDILDKTASFVLKSMDSNNTQVVISTSNLMLHMESGTADEVLDKTLDLGHNSGIDIQSSKSLFTTIAANTPIYTTGYRISGNPLTGDSNDVTYDILDFTIYFTNGTKIHVPVTDDDIEVWLGRQSVNTPLGENITSILTDGWKRYTGQTQVSQAFAALKIAVVGSVDIVSNTTFTMYYLHQRRNVSDRMYETEVMINGTAFDIFIPEHEIWYIGNYTFSFVLPADIESNFTVYITQHRCLYRSDAEGIWKYNICRVSARSNNEATLCLCNGLT